MQQKNDAADDVRLDKWLWAARFFKTRSQAAQAVSGGKVHLNGGRVKPARKVQVGDELVIGRGILVFRVTVLAVCVRRRPAVEARQLYEESEESIRERELQREQRRLMNMDRMAPVRKPDKRDRRKIRSFTRKDD